ncbi:MAG: helix-turn-helix transcriptional regulator [Pseudomonadota bacterium]
MNALLMSAGSFPLLADDASRRHADAGHQIVRALMSACGARPTDAQRHAGLSRPMVKIEITLPGDLASLLASLTIHTWENGRTAIGFSADAGAGAGAMTAYRAVPAQTPAGRHFELRCEQAPHDMTPERFCEAFDITHAEARVLAALVAGEQPKRYALRRSLSIHTVRTQICSLKTKMGCRRQIDLVRKVFALEHRAAGGRDGIGGIGFSQ